MKSQGKVIEIIILRVSHNLKLKQVALAILISPYFSQDTSLDRLLKL